MQSPSYRRRGNQLTLGRPWSYTDLGLLKELASTTPPKLIARKLNRSYESVRQMARRCNILFRKERKQLAELNSNL